MPAGRLITVKPPLFLPKMLPKKPIPFPQIEIVLNFDAWINFVGGVIYFRFLFLVCCLPQYPPPTHDIILQPKENFIAWTPISS